MLNCKLESNLLYLNEQIERIVQGILKFDVKENILIIEKKTDDLSEKLSCDINNFVGNFDEKLSATLEENKEAFSTEIKNMKIKLKIF